MPQTRKLSGRLRLIIGIAFLCAILVAVWTLPLTAWLDTATGWIRVNPRTGRLFYVLGFVLCSVLMVPGSVLAMSGGYLFGLAGAIPIVSISVALGALVAIVLVTYVIHRTASRELNKQMGD